MSEISVTEGGVTVTSTSETPEQIKASIASPESKPAEDLSEAASKLGKEGAAASAAKRAEAKATGGEETPPEAPQDAPETDEKPLGKPRHDPRARMLEATREAAEAKRERDAIKARAEAAERRLAELERAKAPQSTETPQTEAAEAKADLKMPGVDPRDPRPKSEDFENWSDYEDARDMWHDRRRERVSAQRSAAQEHGKALGSTVDKFLERVAGVPKTDPQMAEKFSAFAQTLSPEVQNLRGSFQRQQGEPLDQTHIIADEIIRSDRAPDLMRHLSAHPEDFQRIAALQSPPEIVREMARLEAKLEKADAATTATAPKPQSAARPPLRPVEGTPHIATGEPAEDAPYEQHKAYWTRRDRERQAQR